MGVIEDIREQYPTLSFLLNDPEVGGLLRDAVDPNKGFSPTTFQSKLYQTSWWKTRSQAQRETEILRNTDPAEYRRRIDEARNQVRLLGEQYGINFTGAEVANFAAQNLHRGIGIGSPEFNYSVLQWARRQRAGRFSARGNIHAEARRVSTTARGQYYINLSNSDTFDWGSRLALGTADDNQLRAWLQDKAISRYPHLREQLYQGNSMEDIFSGHRQLIAETLEISPETIDFRNGPWQKVIGTMDPKLNQLRPMSLYETQTLARQDNRWWNTSNGRQADAGMANYILKTFGKRS